MRLNRLKENLKNLSEERKNEQCESCQRTEFIWDVAKGDIVCTNCGVVSQAVIFFDDRAYDIGCDANGARVTLSSSVSPGSLFDPTYVRYFHFNEVLATLTLDGPWINNTDYREIKGALSRQHVTDPTRGDVQRICQSLNKQYSVQRFTKKYTEKWIQIVYRYTGKRPPEMSSYLINGLRNDFKTMVNRWAQVEQLLNVTKKKSEKRVQWPNYLETIYHLLKIRYPQYLPGLKPWIVRLSPKKRKELKQFFLKVFKLVGWVS